MGISQTRHDRLQLMRKHRWFMTMLGTPSNAFRHSVSNMSQIYLAGRPKISFEQRQMVHEIETISYDGRPTWEPIEVTFWDVGGDARVYNWLRKHYDPETGIISNRDEYVVDCQLDMLNGLGDPLERWMIKEAHLAAVDWGQLDYSSTDLAGVTITLGYARAFQERIDVPSGRRSILARSAA